MNWVKNERILVFKSVRWWNINWKIFTTISIAILLLSYSTMPFFYDFSKIRLEHAIGILGDITGTPDSKINKETLYDVFPPVHVFAMIVSSFSLIICTLVFFISLPLFLFSKDELRAKKAAGLVKTSLGFIVASGTSVIATLSFVN
ncbi:MAG: hypothetical protein HQ573_07500 [Desulfobacteraceae bacterium]|nr:hypothetical protein [Desulfobacteraceae bacterium]